MAEKYSFILGALGNNFLQMKTTDNIYLKDLLEGSVFPAIEQYNNTVSTLERILCYKFDDSKANIKDLWGTNSFDKVADIERANNRAQFDSWNHPLPIERYAAGQKLTMEVFRQMTSKKVEEFFNQLMVADRKNVIRRMFEHMATKDPSSAVDELTSIAATPKAFWNDETSMDTPRSNGQITFDGDHQHYLAVATADNLGTNGSELDTLLSRITEHENMNGQPILWARTGATLNLIMNETTNFRKINTIPDLIQGQVGERYDISGLAQALRTGGVTLGYGVKVRGTWKDALVCETPDIPTDYILATMYAGDNSLYSPLAWREHPQFKGLILFSESGGNPLIGKDADYRRYLATWVWNRDAGACLYVGDTSWAEPSFS